MAANETEAVPAPVTSAQVETARARLKSLEDLIAQPSAPTRPRVEAGLQALLDEVMANTALISDDVITTIDELVSQIDRRLSEQVNRIMHHETFQKVERAWRGLDHLVRNTKTDQLLKIRVLDISKEELAQSFRNFQGARWEYSPLAMRIIRGAYEQSGEAPYSSLIADYYFDHSPGDVKLLSQLGQIASTAHAPLISGVAPTLFGMESWQELPNPQKLEPILDSVEYAAWRALRNSEAARYIGLAMPRFMARAPYSERETAGDGFAFREAIAGNHERYCWANAAYAMAANITRAQSLYGWCTQIRGVETGGLVNSLPMHTYQTDDKRVDVKCPTEVLIDDIRDKELTSCGLMPFDFIKNTNTAVFYGAPSFHKVQKFLDNPDANASEVLSSQLPYMFATTRFAHVLKNMLRVKIGAGWEEDRLQKYLSTWISAYCLPTPKDASPEMLAKRPLLKAEVKVERDEDRPGVYTARFALRPHYQLDQVNVTMSLVARLPSERKS